MIIEKKCPKTEHQKPRRGEMIIEKNGIDHDFTRKTPKGYGSYISLQVEFKIVHLSTNPRPLEGQGC